MGCGEGGALTPGAWGTWGGGPWRGVSCRESGLPIAVCTALSLCSPESQIWTEGKHTQVHFGLAGED